LIMDGVRWRHGARERRGLSTAGGLGRRRSLVAVVSASTARSLSS
jgi:hypothetical protein